jgi:EAL domain-containing protein (putative c-di-GMP-specific phosphodiesterase class I)
MDENENDAVIVRSTIDLAHNLGLKVIAEGVETQEVWDILSILGCDQSQGYFTGRPMSAEKLDAWLGELVHPAIPERALRAV